jgi:hypothetical protein
MEARRVPIAPEFSENRAASERSANTFIGPPPHFFRTIRRNPHARASIEDPIPPSARQRGGRRIHRYEHTHGAISGPERRRGVRKSKRHFRRASRGLPQCHRRKSGSGRIGEGHRPRRRRQGGGASRVSFSEDLNSAGRWAEAGCGELRMSEGRQSWRSTRQSPTNQE